jgi:hypothetical protein
MTAEILLLIVSALTGIAGYLLGWEHAQHKFKVGIFRPKSAPEFEPTNFLHEYEGWLDEREAAKSRGITGWENPDKYK